MEDESTLTYPQTFHDFGLKGALSLNENVYESNRIKTIGTRLCDYFRRKFGQGF